MVFKHQKTKTLVTRTNGRSADAISPNFIYGCAGGCMSSYCYVGRFNDSTVYINDNVEDILASIQKWAEIQAWPKVPNQCDSKYYTVDIGCSTDIALHSKHYDLQKIFTFFNEHPFLKSTFATKYPDRIDLDKYDINPEKNRIRVSLMPQIYSYILEPKTTLIEDRINTIKRLQDKFEVHLNFSPIVYDTDRTNWLEEYQKLFMLLACKSVNLPCECIFLTYSDVQAEKAGYFIDESKSLDPTLQKDHKMDLLFPLWIQERKKSEYGGINLRYKHEIKDVMIKDFKQIYSDYFPLTNIRYIF